MSSGRDYYRKPYVSKDYCKMMKRTPLAATQNQKLARHSEHEKPYRDDTYPEMQHYWPGVPGITDPNWDFPWMGDPGIKNCDDIWREMLEAYLPFRSSMDVYRFAEEYEKTGCPLKYVSCYIDNPCYCPGEERCFDAWCTTSPTRLRVEGSTTVDVHFKQKEKQLCITADANETGSFTIFLGTGIGAETQETVEECDDCDLCIGISIGYTTQQMSIDEVQTLTVVGAQGGVTYDWTVISGGGMLSAGSGTSVDYTAPASNVDCANNPTIRLSAGGESCDTLSIAVSGGYTDEEIRIACVNPEAYGIKAYCQCAPPTCYCYYTAYKCSGAIYLTDRLMCQQITGCSNEAGLCEAPACDALLDDRNACQKAMGCCPAALL